MFTITVSLSFRPSVTVLLENETFHPSTGFPLFVTLKVDKTNVSLSLPLFVIVRLYETLPPWVIVLFSISSQDRVNAHFLSFVRFMSKSISSVISISSSYE